MATEKDLILFDVGLEVVAVNVMGVTDLTKGRVYKVQPGTSRSFTRILNDRRENVGVYSWRFRAVEPGTVHKPHLIVHNDVEKSVVTHIGPFNSNTAAEAYAATAFPDGHWLVFELSPQT